MNNWGLDRVEPSDPVEKPSSKNILTIIKVLNQFFSCLFIYYITVVQSEATTHLLGQGHAQQSSLSATLAGLPAEQAESDTFTYFADDTCFRQITSLVRRPRPQVLEHGVQFEMNHLQFGEGES